MAAGVDASSETATTVEAVVRADAPRVVVGVAIVEVVAPGAAVVNLKR